MQAWLLGSLLRGNKAFQSAGIVYPLEKQAKVTEENRFAKGLAVQQEIFGEDNIKAMRRVAPQELKHIQDYLSAYCFGDFYTRGTLDLKMRELVTFCAICCLGGCEPQAKAHAGANLSVGNTREMLVEAITQCLPFIGFPRTLNAISCINEVTAEK
ncbi:carboxymuconolactone decarboxylase family protein [bacterium C-53]|nr:carboxymuconolactone decarboxylase family protein [Lachnospiraceae bacterium]NBI04708.1 carboxymuconolactone decarboxylase family protein [Lachnospiraceae bacterium]RKJ07854.1 carboxymuconolactone decarboxylase family protein [bacterium C-53]